MILSECIKYLYPEAEEDVDYVIVSDVNGIPQLRDWVYSEPEPTAEQINAAWAEISEDVENTHQTKLALLTVTEQLNAFYSGGSSYVTLENVEAIKRELDGLKSAYISNRRLPAISELASVAPAVYELLSLV